FRRLRSGRRRNRFRSGTLTAKHGVETAFEILEIQGTLRVIRRECLMPGILVGNRALGADEDKWNSVTAVLADFLTKLRAADQRHVDGRDDQTRIVLATQIESDGA